MSTRAVIARVGDHEGKFSGVYHHWDGMPTSLGKYLTELLVGHFQNDLSKMLRVLVDEHPAGWSTVYQKDFSLKPGYTWQRVQSPSPSLGEKQYRAARKAYDLHPDIRRPQCFCHGERHEEPSVFTEKDLQDTDVEWLYAIDEQNRRLYIRDVSHDAEEIVELDGTPADWEKIECGEDFSRCKHYAWKHGLLPKSSNLSTKTWLGILELEFHDVVAFSIGGKRFNATGSGGNSNYLRQMTGKNLPPDTWVSTVLAGNNRRLELPVAKITKHGHEPLPGVTWIFPPTKTNPRETKRSS